jgi:hypothetical protein
MIRRVKVVHVWGEVELPTRLKPLRVDCVAEGGERFEVYVKLLSRSDQGRQAFVNETLGGLFARHLKLRAPEPLAVDFPGEILPALADRGIAKAIGDSEGLQFGSMGLSAGHHTAGGVSQQVKRPRDLHDALAILLMDLIMENGDRVENNPNLLVSGQGFAPIDHELAFSNFSCPYEGIAPFRPWEPAFYQRATRMIRNHLLFRTLAGRKLDFSVLEARFKGVSPKALRGLAGQVPLEWVNPELPPERITGYLVEARQQVPKLLKLVEHTLRQP